MGVKIINYEELSRIHFLSNDNGGAKSDKLNFDFWISSEINQPSSIFLSIERNEDVFFINHNGGQTRQINFSPRYNGGDTFNRKIVLFTHSPIHEIDGMSLMLFLKVPDMHTVWQDFATCFIETHN